MKTKRHQNKIKNKIKTNFICLAEITGAYGVHGAVQLRSFAAQAKDVAAYGTLYDETGAQSFKIISVKTVPKNTSLLRVRFEGIDDREAAAALRGVRLYLPREDLPSTSAAEEFYYADLIGLSVRNQAGGVIGHIKQIHNFGAGDILEINNAMIPFNKTYVPEINIAEGFIVIKEDDARKDKTDEKD